MKERGFEAFNSVIAISRYWSWLPPETPCCLEPLVDGGIVQNKHQVPGEREIPPSPVVTSKCETRMIDQKTQILYDGTIL